MMRQEPAAMRDFSPVYVRYGSSATGRYASGDRAVSASLRKRTSERLPRYVRLVPLADICIAADFLFDDFVGASEHCRRHFEAERLAGHAFVARQAALPSCQGSSSCLL